MDLVRVPPPPRAARCASSRASNRPLTLCSAYENGDRIQLSAVAGDGKWFDKLSKRTIAPAPKQSVMDDFADWGPEAKALIA